MKIDCDFYIKQLEIITPGDHYITKRDFLNIHTNALSIHQYPSVAIKGFYARKGEDDIPPPRLLK